MRRSVITALVLVLSMSVPLAAQVIPDSVRVDSVSMPDSVTVDSLSAMPDSLQKPKAEVEEEKEPEPIEPWHQGPGYGFEHMTHDSLLRWQVWPNWGEYYAYRSDVISFRQGTTGRVDAFSIAGYEQDEQKLELNRLDLSNPITGYINYNYVPVHKIGSMTERMSGSYESKITLKDYYILEPVSYLNYEEAKYNFRNLEFMVSQNFSERTNVELSFWDRRDGDSYPRNDVVGSQVFGKLYHYLNQNVQIRALYLRNQFERQEPFGYLVAAPNTFTFDRFASPAQVNSATSDELRRDVQTGIYFRKDSLSSEYMGMELSSTKNEYKMFYTADSLSWDLRNYRASAFRELGLSALKFRVEGGGSYHTFKNERNLNIGNWTSVFVEGNSILTPVEGIQLIASGEYHLRSDGFESTEYGVTADLDIREQMKFQAGGYMFNRMPEINELYWDAETYTGNEDLLNEKGISLHSSLTIHFGDRLTGGVSGRLKLSEHDTYLSSDSTFANQDEYSVISGSAFARFQNYRFEFESSAAVEALNNYNSLRSPEDENLRETKLWIRNNAWIKGYAFERAAYVKMGVRTLVSPFPYGSRYFNPAAQFWMDNTDEIQIPSFFRLDAEISARVRAIMVVMRWENVLDGFGQAGYFEAATYPMPARRFIVGIRAQFRN